VRSVKRAFTLIVIACILLRCDTGSSLDDPNKFFFLKFYGGDGDQTGDDLVALPDGTFILFGTTRPSTAGSTSQWYLVKSDQNGNLVWEKQFGNTGANDEARDIELTSDGRLVAVGNTYVTATNRDVRVMTFTLDGVPIDSAFIPVLDNLGNVTNGDEDAKSITEISDGFMIAGSTTYVTPKPTDGVPGSSDPRDGLNIRIKKDLKPYQSSWPVTQTYGKFADDVSNKVYPVSDGFYLFGYSNSPNSGHTVENYNIWYYKIGLSGVSTDNNYLGNQSENEKPTSVCIAPLQAGGGYLQAGVTYNAGVASLYVSRLRSTLTYTPSDDQFRKSLSITLGTTMDEGTAVFASTQSGYYILGNEKALNDNQNWLLTKVGNDGSPVWTLPIVFGGEGPDTIGGIQELPDGRLVLIGTMRTGKSDTGEFKLTLIKVNQEGKLLN
jgi:hypothetical protein